MNIIDKVKNEIMIFNENFMNESEDKYNFWEEHLKYVVKESLNLAKLYKADKEIVELGALLHDIALLTKTGTRKEHHIIGAEISGKILLKNNYPKDRTVKVQNCVFNHRSSKNSTIIEDICVADADIIAHFDNIPMLFNSIYKNDQKNSMNLSELRNKMLKSFEYDYNDLSEKTKQEFHDQYKLLCKIVIGYNE